MGMGLAKQFALCVSELVDASVVEKEVEELGVRYRLKR